MSINLQKGQKVNLTKDNTGLSCVMACLGWDEAQPGNGFLKRVQPVDCDASVFLLEDGKLSSKKDIVFFGHLRHKSKAVIHKGDNLTGAGDGDDEQIIIDLDKIPEKYDKVIIVVNIYHAKQRQQHFGMVQNAFMRLVDMSNNREILRYDLTGDYSDMAAVIFGELYRYDGEWKFSAVGQGTKDASILDVAARYR